MVSRGSREDVQIICEGRLVLVLDDARLVDVLGAAGRGALRMVGR